MVMGHNNHKQQNLLGRLVLEAVMLAGLVIGVLGLTANSARAEVPNNQSAGCQQVNNGGLNIAYLGFFKEPTVNNNESVPTSLTSNVTDEFFIGEKIIITYDQIIRTVGTDDTRPFTFLDDQTISSQPITQGTADYIIPATGQRSISAEFFVNPQHPETGVSAICEPAVTGTIIIRKQSDVAGSFSFTGDLGAFSLSPTASTIDERIFSDLPIGTYAVTELVDNNSNLIDLACVGDQDSSVDLATATATINLDAGETIRCTFTNEQRKGMISIITQTFGGEGRFDYSSTLQAFTINTDNGSGQKDFADIVPGSYSFTQGPQSDFDLTDIQCNTEAATIDLATATATVSINPGDNIVCRFINVDNFDETRFKNDSVDTIRGFTYRRARAMLNAEPDRTNFFRRNPDVLWDDEGATPLKLSARATPFRSNYRFMAHTSRSQDGLSPDGVELWVEGSYSEAKDDFSDGTIDSSFGIIYAGADIQPRDNIIIGALVSFDWADESIDLFNQSTEQLIQQQVDGTGWMVGPYLAARLSEKLFFTGRVAAGRSDNQLSLDTRVKDDPFDTERFLARAALTGNHVFGAFRFTPTASLTWFSETSQAYISKTGVAIPETKLNLGRAELKPEIAWRHDLESGNWWESQLAFSGIWDFDRPENLAVQNIPLPTEAVRGRLEGGLQFNWKNGNSLRFSTAYDGIGADGYEAYSAGLWFDMPLGRSKPAPKPGPAIPPPAYKYCSDGSRILEVDPCPEEKIKIPTPPEDLKLVVYFDHDKSDLSREAQAKIDEAVEAMSGKSVKIVLLSGHTDLSGSDQYNEPLSMRRALVVRDALVAHNIAIDKITYEFFGETKPAVPTKDGVRLRANRRTEVVIKFN